MNVTIKPPPPPPPCVNLFSTMSRNHMFSALFGDLFLTTPQPHDETTLLPHDATTFSQHLALRAVAYNTLSILDQRTGGCAITLHSLRFASLHSLRPSACGHRTLTSVQSCCKTPGNQETTSNMAHRIGGTALHCGLTQSYSSRTWRSLSANPPACSISLCSVHRTARCGLAPPKLAAKRVPLSLSLSLFFF